MGPRFLPSWRRTVVRLSVLPDDGSPGAWTGRTLELLCAGLALGLSFTTANNVLAGRHRTAAALGSELVVVAAAAVLNRRGAPQRAAGLLAASLPAVATVVMINGYGMRDVASLMLPGSLVVGGLILSRPALAALAMLNVAASTLVITAEAHGLVLSPAEGYPYLRQSLNAGVIIVLTAVGVGLVSEQLRRTVDRVRREQAALRASEERYRSLIDLGVDAVFIVGPDRAIVETNRRACELTGYQPEELAGRLMDSLYSPADLVHAPMRYDLIERGHTVAVDRELVRKDGSTVPVEASSKRMPDGSWQSTLRDVSERRRAEADRLALEARLRQSQKMEALGRLAGGVAHDFNNLLTAITGSLTLALRDVPPGARAHRWLSEVDAAAWRAASLTRQMLAFSRQQMIAPRVVDLRALVEGVRPMLARLIGEDVELDTALPQAPCLAEVDQGQIEQVLLNLAANARDAMPNGGRLTLAVSGAEVDELYVSIRPEARPGSHVVLSVTDTGHGMTDDVRSRVFEPFFTTKPAGSGTGLGLAMVYGAVQQNRGWIEVDSTPGRGTNFRIFFPRSARGIAAAAGPDEDRSLRGSETVLLVEDEATVREVIAVQLESLGYRVLPCADGHEALGTACAHAGPLDLLLTDIVMPGMSGRELADRLLALRPALRVLFTSGYGEDVIGRHGVLRPGVHFLAKPWSQPELARKVRETLGGARQAEG